MAGMAAGAAKTFLVRLPANMPPGVAYLELAQGPFVGGACPVLVMPLELAAAASELLQALHARDAMLKSSSPLAGACCTPNTGCWPSAARSVLCAPCHSSEAAVQVPMHVWRLSRVCIECNRPMAHCNCR